MRLLSVNVGRAELLPGTREPRTGIMKRPQAKPVRINRLGLADDAICNTRHHGGPDQAVYLYGQPDYDWWSATLDHELPPGTFGENLTVADMASASIHIGDRFTIGAVVLEVTSPRIPCATLAARMGDKRFVKQFTKAERPGVYCRVMQEGEVRAGDAVVHDAYEGERVGVLELFRTFNRRDLDTKTIRRYLAVPMHHKERAVLEEMLAAR